MTEEKPKIKHTLLIIGILFLLAGFIGVAGLRLGIIQNLLGDPDPYPGIGSVEPSGHIVSMVPFVLGLVIVLAWGIRNNPVYYELEKIKEEADEDDEESDDEEEPDEDEESENAPEYAEEEIPPEQKPEEPEAHGPAPKPAPEPESPEEPKGMTIDSIPEDLRDELLDSISDIEQELSKIQPAAAPREKPEIKKAKKPTVLEGEAEKKRVERCNKMLSFADMSKEDKDQLSALIDTGISVHDFTQEVKEAVQKQKDRKAAEAKTADQKAAYLEDDLVAELSSLEDELDDDIDEAALEDMILSTVGKKKQKKSD